MEVITVFYSTTEEEGLKKYRGYFTAQCKQLEGLLDVKFNVLYWREMPGGLGKSAQDVINRHTVGKYDIYFGVMGTTFGKGTEEEYRLAVGEHIKRSRPTFACFGFCDAPVDPYSVNLESFAKLKKFQSDLGKGRKYGKANLYFKFKDRKAFVEAINANLKQAVSMIKGRVAGGARY
jgi:hypothetical protein